MAFNSTPSPKPVRASGFGTPVATIAFSETTVNTVLELCIGAEGITPSTGRLKAVKELATAAKQAIERAYDPAKDVDKQKARLAGFEAREKKMEAEVKIQELKDAVAKAEYELKNKISGGFGVIGSKDEYSKFLESTYDKVDQIIGRKRKAGEISGGETGMNGTT